MTYSHLPPGYGFSTRYTLSDNLERLYEVPPKLVTKDHHSTGKTVYRVGEYQEKSDQNCFIFANQDDTSGHGDNDLNGKWFVAGYFCMPHPLVHNRATLGAFLDRIAADKAFKAARNPQ